jgi:hypothetical protein
MSFTAFKALADNRWKFGWFMLRSLPSAFFCGVRLRQLSEREAMISVPFGWLTQNPFRSMYFACQAMAAEMSTGVLALGHIHQRRPRVSMLVKRLEAIYHKKATEKVYFTCTDGLEMLKAIEAAIQSGQGTSCTATSQGKTAAGELVSVFKIEWSFKAKSEFVSSIPPK